MTYHTLYDVADDSAFAGREAGLVFLLVAVGWTALWLLIHWLIRRTRPAAVDGRWNWLGGLVVGVVLIAVGVAVVVTDTYPAYLVQRQCREWVKAGDYQTAEGPVTDFRVENGKSPPRHFQVAGLPFTYRMSTNDGGGFRGTFTAPGAEDRRLANGLQVRIAHRDGRILRIEVVN